mmetsp:Transcript_8505/g.33623  ORF Transcript_8505/g.33623 Transcript_8505/m.33623 type:complete len:262 (+) Transcript_8505:3319-4104(+)
MAPGTAVEVPAAPAEAMKQVPAQACPLARARPAGCPSHPGCHRRLRVQLQPPSRRHRRPGQQLRAPQRQRRQALLSAGWQGPGTLAGPRMAPEGVLLRQRRRLQRSARPRRPEQLAPRHIRPPWPSLPVRRRPRPDQPVLPRLGRERRPKPQTPLATLTTTTTTTTVSVASSSRMYRRCLRTTRPRRRRAHESPWGPRRAQQRGALEHTGTVPRQDRPPTQTGSLTPRTATAVTAPGRRSGAGSEPLPIPAPQSARERRGR